MILTGLRIGEALAMQWKYYHKDGNGAGYYEVERQLNYNKDLVVPKTDRSRDGVTTGTQCFFKCLAKAMIGGPAQKYSNRNGE